MKYHDVQPISRQEAVEVLAGTNSVTICHALVSLAFHEPDWQWVQGQCVDRLRDGNTDVAGVAATCLGHLARLHRCLDMSSVIPALESAKKRDEIRGRVEDALDDIQTYLGKNKRRVREET